MVSTRMTRVLIAHPTHELYRGTMQSMKGLVRKPKSLRYLHTSIPSVPAFTSSSLSSLKNHLLPIPTHSPHQPPPHTLSFQGDTSRSPSEAAILIPLMNYDGLPHLLFQIRAKQLRVHAGEVSFPGGKSDPEDETVVNTALRETWEELGIPPNQVELLGSLPPEYSLGNRSRVWPIVGFLKSPSTNIIEHSSKTTLPDYPLSTLTPSSSEVSALLPFPISTIFQENRRRTHYFRLDVRRPYHKFLIDDLILWPPELSIDTKFTEKLESKELKIGQEIWKSQPSKVEGLEIWGLSGWFFNVLAVRFGWLIPPPKGYDMSDD